MERYHYDVRCDCRCCGEALESCPAKSCQTLWSRMELPDKQGWPEPLHWRRWAEGRHPKEETPQPVFLHAHDLDDSHSRDFYRLLWGSVPQEHHRIAPKDFAAGPRMTLMNLAFSLPTSAPPISLVLRPSRAGCEQRRSPSAIICLPAQGRAAAWVHRPI